MLPSGFFSSESKDIWITSFINEINGLIIIETQNFYLKNEYAYISIIWIFYFGVGLKASLSITKMITSK